MHELQNYDMNWGKPGTICQNMAQIEKIRHGLKIWGIK